MPAFRLSSENTEPRVVPIVQSTTYVFDSTDDVAAVFDDPTKALIYSRFANPTVMAVEDKIAELEGGIGAMCTTSGQAANLLAILNICRAGDSFISTTQIYGGTINLFGFTLKNSVLNVFSSAKTLPMKKSKRHSSRIRKLFSVKRSLIRRFPFSILNVLLKSRTNTAYRLSSTIHLLRRFCANRSISARIL